MERDAILEGVLFDMDCLAMDFHFVKLGFVPRDGNFAFHEVISFATKHGGKLLWNEIGRNFFFNILATENLKTDSGLRVNSTSVQITVPSPNPTTQNPPPNPQLIKKQTVHKYPRVAADALLHRQIERTPASVCLSISLSLSRASPRRRSPPKLPEWPIRTTTPEVPTTEAKLRAESCRRVSRTASFRSRT
ncbi:hypothetical protein DVH24_032489 [Malus domestica]|uniref:Uncharacterized protein n=1 Tax=Malus domestica TaxID=3750 RepID=A0A498J8D8_MALDO|nr:hypothetical protein DVH24_032489 [Malus domestica]